MVQEKLVIGIDLGGSKVNIALLDSFGHVVASEIYPTKPETGADSIILGMVNRINTMRLNSQVETAAIGVGVAGQLDRQTGVVHFSPNLDWREVPLRERLAQALGLPVSVTNDVRAATYGEWQAGAGQGVSDLVCLFIGTGVGGGIVSGGILLSGASNTAGELGHLTVMANGRKCTCGGRGCLEAYAGGWAIAERAREAVRASRQAGMRLITLAGGIEQINAQTVAQAYHSGDLFAKKLVEDTAEYLAAGLVSIINALNPNLIIIGGGVANGLPEYISLAEKIARGKALKAALPGLRITQAWLGDNSAAIGAAMLARQELISVGYQNGS